MHSIKPARVHKHPFDFDFMFKLLFVIFPNSKIATKLNKKAK